MFLSDGGVARQRFGRPCAGATSCANYPLGSVTSSSLAHGCSFRRSATPEQRPSPKRKSVGPTATPPHRPTVSPCLSVWLTQERPETAWDFHRSVWPAIVSRRDHQPPRRAAGTNRSVCRERILWEPRVLPQASELGTPPRPKRGPSRTILAWPLRQRPLPCAAGCVPLRRESSSKDFRTGTAPRG